VPIAASGLLQTALGLTTTQLTLALFALPSGFALLVETPLMLWASRRPPGRVVAVALAAVGIGALLTAYASSFTALLLALMLWYPAIGVAAGLGQAALMDAAPDARAANLTRWTIAATIGDLAAPCLLGLSLRFGSGVRPALFAVALIAFLAALRLWRVRAPIDLDDEAAPPVRRRSLARLRANRPLIAWLIGAALCDLMDETLVALAALRVQAQFGEDALALTTVLGALNVSALLGLTVADRLLVRYAARRLLAVSCLASIAAFALFLWCDGLLGMTIAIIFVGASAALHHPLAQAEAYAAEPDDAAWVATLGSVFGIGALVAPPILGWVADAHGLVAALALLLVQPLGLLWVVLAMRADRH
jgi:MFS family permease